jgi:hypothetical protein
MVIIYNDNRETNIFTGLKELADTSREFVITNILFNAPTQR